MFFSPNIKETEVNTVKGIFNLNVISIHEKYLGLPSVVGKNKGDCGL